MTSSYPRPSGSLECIPGAGSWSRATFNGTRWCLWTFLLVWTVGFGNPIGTVDDGVYVPGGSTVHWRGGGSRARGSRTGPVRWIGRVRDIDMVRGRLLLALNMLGAMIAWNLSFVLSST